MDNLLEQVERARRKMVRNQFVVRLIWWLSGALAVAAVAIATPKLVALPELPARWAEAWLISAAVVAFVGAGLATYVRRDNQLDAAVEIDRRFDLRERVASSLSLPESEQTTEVGQALINDAARSVERIDVDQEFPLQLGRRAWLPIVPAVIAFALMTLVGDREPADAKSKNPTVATAEQVRKSAEELRKKIAEKQKEAEQNEELKDAAKLLKEVKEGVEEVAKRDNADRKDATVKLNDLAKRLEKRKQELGGSQAVRNELNKLKNLGKGPAEKAAEAMKQGDWEKALREVEQMRKKLAEGKMSPADQQKLAEQLGKMKEQLEKAAKAQKQAMEDLKKQIAEQQRKGNKAEAEKLQQKLDQMQQQQQQMQQLEQMAQKMGQAQKAMQQGDQQAAAEAMNQLGQQLEQMQQEIDEMEMLDGAQDQIEMAKMAMGCQQCQGDGCQACQGQGFGMGQGRGEGQGQGMGKGRGSGPRPDEENPTATRDTRVRQNPGRGASTYGGQVKGPNIKGEVRQQVRQALTADEIEPAEAVDDERLPRGRREHAREYFEKLRQEL